MSEAPQPASAASATLATATPLVDPDLVEAARILRRALVRVHPSFRFEERLATQLDAAAALGSGRAAGLSGRPADPLDPAPLAHGPIPFPVLGLVEGDADVFPLPAWRPGRRWRAPSLPVGLATHVPRGALIGGAIASGVSLAGAAILARRWTRRPSRSPFARAARAAHRPGGGPVAPGGLA